MKPELLDVVAVYSNPMRWLSRRKLQLEFEQRMLDAGVRLTTVELVLGDRPFELDPPPEPVQRGSPFRPVQRVLKAVPNMFRRFINAEPEVTRENNHINRVQIRHNTVVWTKENCLNIGIQRLPSDWKYVAWIDADIKFRRETWAEDTVHALQQYQVVQPWETCIDLGPDDEHMQAHKSFCSLYAQGYPIKQKPQYTFAHPGYAWAARREALEGVGGLIECGALGAGDHHMAMALIGRVKESTPGGLSDAYMQTLIQWEQRATRYVNRNIGYVPGTIEHYWHGKKADRKYVGRWDILRKHKFDPNTDLRRNMYGVLELTDNKPDLRRDIDMYFRQRNEDSNAL